MFTNKKKNYSKKLNDEKAKQKAMVILGEFKAMDTGNIKMVEDSFDQDDLKVDTKISKATDNLAWLTNYVPAQLGSMAKKNKLFGNVFNLYRIEKD